MSIKMDLKPDDMLNIDLDPALLLSYELDKLNLDNIPNDIFEFSEEITENCDNSDDYKEPLPESKLTEEKCTSKLSLAEDGLDTFERENHLRNLKQIKDVNGNEEPACEQLNQLLDKLDLSGSGDIKVKLIDAENVKVELSDFENVKVDLSENVKVELSGTENVKVELSDSENVKVELSENIKVELSDSDNDKGEFSDSDNEDLNEDHTKLIERAPVKKQSRAKKNRDQISILSKNRNPDKSQFNPQTLKFLSGSSQINFNEPYITDTTYLASTLTRSETVPSPSLQDFFYEDVRAKTVSSPESGYESTSAQDGTSSPPLLPLYNLDYIPESVDEQNILEFLVENTTESALSNNNLSVRDSDDKDAKGKIIEIINYLKDIPDELNEPSNRTVSSNNSHEQVPLVNGTPVLNTRSLPLTCSPVSKIADTPRKLVYKLNDKAKDALREFLSDEEFFAAEKRIYRRLNKAGNGKNVKVIYVEDETDKASENRTNLHHAVLDSRIEDIYCLVEIQKQYKKPLSDINIRDKYGKTALDYAIQNKMTLVVDYLKENTACQSVNI